MSDEERTARAPQGGGASASLKNAVSPMEEGEHVALENGAVRCAGLEFDALQRERARRVRQIMERHYADGAPDLALAGLGIDPGSLKETFRSVFGTSLSDYLRQIRLAKAKAALLEGQSTAETARSTGFRSAADFRARFMDRTGLSPEDFARGRRSDRRWRFMETPLGWLRLEEGRRGILSVRFVPEAEEDHAQGARYLDRALCQLEEYFAGTRRRFDVPLDLRGTEFQRAVWRELTDIPFGQTRSYGQIAAALGNSRGARAVGMANNRNPAAVIVPCHRVIGADGAPVGYGAGIERKLCLLDFERRAAKAQQILTAE